jgi:hypothetical protein
VEDATLPAAVKVRDGNACTWRRGIPYRPHSLDEDSEPQGVARKACPCPWLGTPLTLAKGHHICRPPRRHWICASSPLWRTRAYTALLPTLGFLTHARGAGANI